MKDQDQDRFDQLVSLTLNASQKSSVASKLLQKWLSYCKISKEELPIKQFEAHLKLKSAFVFNKDNPFRLNPYVHLLRQSQDLQFVELQVFLGHYIFRNITLHFIEKESQHHSLLLKRGGSFGDVYQCFWFRQEVAVKCVRYNLSTFQTVLRDVLAQYCIGQLAESMKVGPKLSTPAGFQIIVYSGCIQFAMEYCDEAGFSNIGCRAKQQLAENLKNMHLANIVHSDIKPDNICYSHHHQRHIFIDFGLARILQESLGFKSKTKFRGTAMFCGEEMRAIPNNGEAWIDLYYNDIESLEKQFEYAKGVDLSYEHFRLQRIDRQNRFSKTEDMTRFHKASALRFYNYNNADRKSEIFSEKLVHSQGLKMIYDQLLLAIHSNNRKFEGFDVWNDQKSYEIEILNHPLIAESLNMHQIASLLSRVLKINSNKYSSKEKIKISKKAMTLLNLERQMDTNIQQQISTIQSKNIELKKVSKKIFEYCFQPIESSKIAILANIGVNVVLLKMISVHQMIHYFRLIMESTMQIEIKVILILELYIIFCWFVHICNHAEFVLQNRLIQNEIIKFCDLPNISQAKQSKILLIIFARQKANNLKIGVLTEDVRIQILQRKIDLLRTCLDYFQFDEMIAQQWVKYEFYEYTYRLIDRQIINNLRQKYFTIQYYHLLLFTSLYNNRTKILFYKLKQKINQCLNEQILHKTQINVLQLSNICFSKQIANPYQYIQTIALFISNNQKYINNFHLKKILQLELLKIIFIKFQIFSRMKYQLQSVIIKAYIIIILQKIHQQNFIQQFLYALNQLIKIQQVGYYLSEINIIYSLSRTGVNLPAYLKNIYLQFKKQKQKQKQNNIQSSLLTNFALANLLMFNNKNKQASLIFNHTLKAIHKTTLPLKLYQYILCFLQFNQNTQYISEEIRSISYRYVNMLIQSSLFNRIFIKRQIFFQLIRIFYHSQISYLIQFIKQINKQLCKYQSDLYTSAFIAVLVQNYRFHMEIQNNLLVYLNTNLLIFKSMHLLKNQPYLSLLCYQFISFHLIPADTKIFKYIFKSFAEITISAFKYISKSIYRQFFDAFSSTFSKRRAKKLLILIIRNSNIPINIHNFMSIYFKKTKKQNNIHINYCKEYLKRFHDINYNQNLKIEILDRRPYISFDKYIRKAIDLFNK